MSTRRRVLAAVAAAALAGCASPDFDYSNEGAAGDGATPRPADGDPTPTADERAEPPQTDGPTESAPTEGPNGTKPTNGTKTASDSDTVNDSETPSGSETPDHTATENGTRDSTTTGTGAAPPQSTALSTSAFEDGGSIPERFTADGVNVSPPLTVRALPDAATVYALLLEDLDVDDSPFTHWLVWNVAPGIEEVPAGIPQEEKEVAALGGARQGTNDFGTVGYRGPAPPASDPPHSYRFAVLALEAGLSLPPGADRAAFDEAVSNVVLGRDEVVASYVH